MNKETLKKRKAMQRKLKQGTLKTKTDRAEEKQKAKDKHLYNFIHR